MQSSILRLTFWNSSPTCKSVNQVSWNGGSQVRRLTSENWLFLMFICNCPHQEISDQYGRDLGGHASPSKEVNADWQLCYLDWRVYHTAFENSAGFSVRSPPLVISEQDRTTWTAMVNYRPSKLSLKYGCCDSRCSKLKLGHQRIRFSTYATNEFEASKVRFPKRFYLF